MVSIPRLKQITPSSDQPANDRINLRVKDQASNILKSTNQVSALGERAVQINKAYEDSKIDSLSSEANQKYALWNTQKLQELKNHKGDPTDAYAQYDVDEKAFFDNLIEEKPSLNPRVRSGLTDNLAKSQNSNRVKVLKQRGYQKEVYEHNLFTADLDLNKKELAVSASYIEKGDRTSSIKFNEELNNIRTLVAKNAMRNGTAEEVEDGNGDHRYRDPDGNEIKVKLSNVAKSKTYTEMNKGVVNSVDVLIASNKTGEARDMMEDYSTYIDAKSRAKFEKRLKVSEDTNEARAYLQTIRLKSEDDQVKLIDNIKDSEVRSEALKIKHLDDTRLKAMRKRSEDKNFDRVNGVIDQLREQGQLYTEKSITDHPEIKMVLQKASLSPTQMRVLNEEFKSPKFSEAEAQMRVTDIRLGVHPTLKLGSMTSAQIAEASVGLSKSDKSKFRTAALSKQKDKGSLEISHKINTRSTKLLMDQLYATELIENDDFGKLKDKNFLIAKKAKIELIDYLDNLNLEKASTKEINDHITDFINDKSQDKLFGRSSGSSWFNFSKDEIKTTPKSKNKDSLDPFKGLDAQSKRDLQKEYMRDTGTRRLPTLDNSDFRTWVEGNK